MGNNMTDSIKQGEEQLLVKENVAVLKLDEALTSQTVDKPGNGNGDGSAFDSMKFAIGILFYVVFVYVFNRYPGCFWQVWLAVALVIFPYRMWNDWNAKPLRQILYHVDYCWVMNYSLLAVLLLAAIGVRTPQWLQNHVFTTIVGVGCGPLMGTNLFPFVAVVFEDFSTMTCFFIHMTPCMVAYTLIWHREEILASWPSKYMHSDSQSVQIFTQSGGPFLLEHHAIRTVLENVIVLYLLWSVPYISWMLVYGLKITRRNRLDKQGGPGFDTGFHLFQRNSFCEFIGTSFWGRPVEVSRQQILNGDYEPRDFVAFMVFHVTYLGTFAAIMPHICFESELIHATVLWFLISITLFRGVQRYIDRYFLLFSAKNDESVFGYAMESRFLMQGVREHLMI